MKQNNFLLIGTFVLGMLVMATITPREFNTRLFSPDVSASDNAIAINGDGNQVAYNLPEPTPARAGDNKALLIAVVLGFVVSVAAIAGTILYISHGAQQELGRVTEPTQEPPNCECVHTVMEA